MARIALKNCECGGKAKLEMYRLAEDAMGCHVECGKCGARTHEYEDAYAPHQEASIRWNEGERITTP